AHRWGTTTPGPVPGVVVQGCRFFDAGLLSRFSRPALTAELRHIFRASSLTGRDNGRSHTFTSPQI
ncbi:hypothetical protein, partial [Stenotrophomonas sp. PS02289]|uniref:hypothetical protein n=1 Tax=Stenotrophomonas sp. PS02289 TaxID=2991422 RepID=UPI002499FC14